jgi:hypothetical protein
MRLEELFPDGDYRHHLTLRRAAPGDFFGPQDTAGVVLRERIRWLDAEPARYAALEPGGEALLREFTALLPVWGGAGAEYSDPGVHSIAGLGRRLEPDILLLARDDAGDFRLRGGALCFPTGWALTEKIGHTLEFIHGVVPGLNAALAPAINQMLGGMKPGVAYLRDNWGIAASAELNLHPARAIPPPEPPVSLERLWLRVEHQALVALPRTRGIAFGIRIALHRLDGVMQGAAGPGLRRALASMSAEMADYKRLDKVRVDLVNVV